MVLLILGFIFLICGIIFFYKANQIKINKNQQQEQYKQKLEKEVHNLQIDRNNLINSEIKKRQQINQDTLLFKQQQERELNRNFQKEKKLLQLKLQEVNNKTEKQIEIIHQDLNNIRQSAAQQKQQIQNEIEKMRASLSAGVQARLRDLEKKDKLNFYKLSINDADLSDVKKLQNL